jgi:hypothetical protein
MNENYYRGLNPMSRVYTAKQKLNDASEAAEKAIDDTVGEFVPLPLGYRHNGSRHIETPAAARNGIGLTESGMFMHNYKSGPANYWIRDLRPSEMLATVEEVENKVDAIVAALGQYAAECAAVSSHRLIEESAHLMALTSASDVAARLRDYANRISPLKDPTTVF